MDINILYPSTGAGRAAIEQLRKKMSSLNRTSIIYKQLQQNERELMTADEMVTARGGNKQLEEKVLRDLTALEDWLLHNRKEDGALEIFIQLRILNTHLLMRFYDRYR